MVSQGRFEHIGRASIRFEGATARGVWLRVDHWSIAMEKRPKSRCGALFHVANRTVSFHGAARDAVRFLFCCPFLKGRLLRRYRSCRQFNETRFRIGWFHFSNPHSPRNQVCLGRVAELLLQADVPYGSLKSIAPVQDATPKHNNPGRRLPES